MPQGTDLVGHEGGDGAPNLVIVHVVLLGPSSTKRNRTGTGTSSTASSSTASCSRTKAMVGWSRNSTQPGGHKGHRGHQGARQEVPTPLSCPPLHTHEHHRGLSIVRDLLQQLQLVL